MKALILPLVLAVAGAGVGVGAGLFLRPASEPSGETVDDGTAAPEAGTEGGENAAEGESVAEGAAIDGLASGPATDPMPGRDRPPMDQIDFVRMTNQFVVPVLRQGEVRALVVVSVGLEVRAGLRETVFAREPKLRDAFLRVMFDHANAGGFDGSFTSGPQMAVLRRNLWEAALPVLGADLFDILITDIARQDS